MINRAKFHFDNIYRTNSPIYGTIRLFQIGDLNCEPGYLVDTHQQVVHEFTYVVSGHGYFTANKKEYPIEKEALLYIRKGESHRIISSETDPLRFFYLGFDFIESSDTSDQHLRTFYENTDFIASKGSSVIHNTFIKLFTEVLTQDQHSDELIKGYLQEILIHSLRLFLTENQEKYILRAVSTSNDKLVYDVLHFIDTHIETLTNLRALQNEFGYSYTTLASKVANQIGQSLKAYHTDCRFRRANELMQQGYTATETAEQIGFQSIHSFSKAYKNHFGFSPTDYKKHKRSN